ncbi:MAG TPA: outer membrane beta-barrel protein [Longimicrobiales bacterium]|nr:outer membrane beta-barrel protein [Longimicrobiales bacterium]
MKKRVLFGLVLAGVVGAAPVEAQLATGEQRPVRVMGGLQLVGAVSTGEFADYVDGGFGAGANIVWPVQAESWFALRGDIGWIVYGSDTKRVCFQSTGCFVTLRLTTTNSILYVNAGPQLMAPRGAVRPYVNANAGFAYFSTTSSVKGDNDSDSFASDTNFDDFTFAWGAGGGFLVPLSSGRTPISLDLGAAYHANGSVEYLTEGDIEENPQGGSPIITPTRSEANFVSIRLGVTIGFRPGVN